MAQKQKLKSQKLLEDHPIPSYSWLSNWKCPNCSKEHSKPHFPFPNQIDENKKPGAFGRIKEKFKREKADGGEIVSCEDMLKKEGTGPIIDAKTGLQSPMFCSHCGWVDPIIHIVKK